MYRDRGGRRDDTKYEKSCGLLLTSDSTTLADGTDAEGVGTGDVGVTLLLTPTDGSTTLTTSEKTLENANGCDSDWLGSSNDRDGRVNTGGVQEESSAQLQG